MTVTIMKTKNFKNSGGECLKTWVGIFQVGIFWVGIFRVGIFQGGVSWYRNIVTITCICFRYLVFHKKVVCVVSLSDFYQKRPFPLLYARWSWPNDWEVIITKWKKWIKPIHRTNFLWGGGLMLIAGLSFQLEYHSNCSKMDLPFINEGCWRKYWFTKDL